MAIKITDFQDYNYAAINPPPAGMGKLGLVHHFGFDEDARYQRIGEQARRLLSTKGGPVAGCSFKITGTPNCAIVSQDLSINGPEGRSGLVVIEGKTAGTGTKLELQDSSGKTLDSIDIDVASPVGIKVRYYNLIDSGHSSGVIPYQGGPVPAAFANSALGDLTDKVNSIVAVQSDCLLAQSGGGALRDLVASNSLGGAVNINSFNIFSFSGSGMDPDAQYHVIFVWAIDGPHSNGITKSNTTLLRADLSEAHRAITLAHEFGHFLSGSGVVTIGDHDDRHSDLMFKTFPHGINMRKARLQKLLGLRKPVP
jgi:hypothetical protein